MIRAFLDHFRSQESRHDPILFPHADVYNMMPLYVPGVKTGDVKARAEEAAKKAIALDPNLAEAHAALGFIKRVYHFDYKGAEREYQRAIELNPNYATAHHFYAAVLLGAGRLEEAIAETRRALELDPFSFNYNLLLGWRLMRAQQYNAAIQQFQRTLELDSNNANVLNYMQHTFLLDKRFEDATSAFVRWAELTGGDKEAVKLYVSFVEEYVRTGEPVSLPPELENFLGNNHEYYAMLGQKEKTLELLEKKYEEGDHWGLQDLKIEQEYDFLRSEPRFIALMRKMGLEE